MTPEDWSAVTTRLLSDFGDVALPPMLQPWISGDPYAIALPLDPMLVAVHRGAFVEFYLRLVGAALADHELTDDEMRELRHVAAVLRIEDGDAMRTYPDHVRQLVADELAVILEDNRVDPVEAIRKARLQDLLGLGYDAFLMLARDQEMKVIGRLMEEMRRRGESAQWLQQRTAALDTAIRFRVP